MSQWGFIKNIIKNTKKAKMDAKYKKAFGPQQSKPKEDVYKNFRNNLAEEIKEEKAFRKSAGKEFNRRYTSPYADMYGADVYEPLTEGRHSKTYIERKLNALQNYKKGNLTNYQKEMFDKEFSK